MLECIRKKQLIKKQDSRLWHPSHHHPYWDGTLWWCSYLGLPILFLVTSDLCATRKLNKLISLKVGHWWNCTLVCWWCPSGAIGWTCVSLQEEITQHQSINNPWHPPGSMVQCDKRWKPPCLCLHSDFRSLADSASHSHSLDAGNVL